jgi:hypothetical protein
MVITCHYRNYNACKKLNCDCHETSEA